MPGNWRIPAGEKHAVLREYRFNIAFENSVAPGYTTEKIFEPLICNTIPIYWGDPFVTNDFNPGAFINVSNFKDYDAVIKHLAELESNEDLLLKILNEPPLHNNIVPGHLKEEKLISFLEKVIYKSGFPVSSKPAYAYNRALYKARVVQKKIINKLINLK
jgi:alpha(1,3/1,4) fucosyltransferase